MTVDGFTLTTRNLEETRVFARVLACHVRPGDVIILTGNLGAGKTTFTQSMAAAMGVRGRVSSPTFVIAREHESTGEGPGLVHVDAYRIDNSMELDDLDLDSELEDVVTVIEWGRGKAEQLSESYLDITIDRTDSDPESEARSYTLTSHGPAWVGRIGGIFSDCTAELT